jgi:hypothetical protein
MKTFADTKAFKSLELPELTTAVGIAAGRKRQEVGGAVCLLGIAAAGIILL